LPEGIPTVPQKFSNDLPDFDLFFFVLYTINEQIQNIAQKKDTLCRRMYN